MAKSVIFLLVSVFLFYFDFCEAGRHHHNNNNKLMELLTAGIVAKVLQKQEEGGGGGHEYYPVPVHIPVGHHHHHGMHTSESQKHHHHVTEKIIPIPIPHHTTRIIHINAGSNGGSSLGSDSGSHSGGSGFDSGGSYSNGHSQYDNNEHDDAQGHHSGSSPSIQQILFHDNGVYGHPMTPPAMPMRHPAYMAYRRPMVGLMPAAATHPAYMVRGRYPYVAVRQRMPYPPMAAPTHYGPPIYAMPYRRSPMAATYMNPTVMRRPATAWYGR